MMHALHLTGPESRYRCFKVAAFWLIKIKSEYLFAICSIYSA